MGCYLRGGACAAQALKWGIFKRRQYKEIEEGEMGQIPEFGEILRAWSPELRLLDISPLTPDASLRRYFRLSLENAPEKSVLAMVFDSLACAEVVSGPKQNSDDSYVELSEFFSHHSFPVPRLLFDGRTSENTVLLIEDLGDSQLGEVLEKQGPETVSQYYHEALSLIQAMQKIPAENGRIAFKRKFSRDLYRKEMQEFCDYFLLRHKFSQSKRVEELFNTLADTIAELPLVLAHRDFHSWNLMIDQTSSLRVIDFQDALLAPRSYDLVALLNDRGSDELLGEKLYQQLYQAFVDQMGFKDSFKREYSLVLLQRDLKVIGRFAKLVDQRNLPQYERWIPGTSARALKTLHYLAGVGDRESGQLVDLLRDLLYVDN